MNISEYHSISTLIHIWKKVKNIALDEEEIEIIKKSHSYLQQKTTTSEASIYGVNTGFGALCDTKIELDELSKLQVNLLRSHACGCGDFVPKPIIKLMILLKIKSLVKGYSGVQLKLVEKLISLYNHDTLPVIYEMGSLGASGDLAPLAHLSLPLIGEGYVWKNDTTEKAPVSNLKLGAKEGLALINGTQFMQAYGLYILNYANGIFKRSIINTAACLDAYDGLLGPFLPFSHDIRPHLGQKFAAENILKILDGSKIANRQKNIVQDPYSFRCAPQVLGASWDVFEQVKRIFEIEINSVTDNPNIFVDEDLILSAGNFHGQPLAMHLDFLAIALAEIGSISERRIYRLLEGKRGLPAFLAENPGIESGLMIAQYTAASLVSQNKQYCTPSSVDSMESSNGQEDHVSMGANAATKCLKVMKNVMLIQSIELLTAYRALHFRKPLKSSDIIENQMKRVQEIVGQDMSDAILSDQINAIRNLIIENDSEAL